jgi:uncharacterized protein YndB with AHSA1/START domain
MARHETVITRPDANTLCFERVFDAPRALVWKVWTDPEHVAKWWGPEGFTNSIHKMEVRPGGEWSLTMHGPDGTDWPNHIRYVEVREPEFLSYHHGGKPGDEGAFFVTAEFVDLGKRTKIVNTLICKTVEQAAEISKIAEHGHHSTWNRLEAYLEEAQARQPEPTEPAENN